MTTPVSRRGWWHWPRRYWIVGAIGLAIVAIVWTSGTALLSGDRAWERIQRDGVLRVATDASYPPFSAVGPDGALYGLDVDLAQAFASRIGVEARIENITYDALLQAVDSERVDVVISAFVGDPNQLDDAAYSDSYFVAGLRVVAPVNVATDLNAATPWTWAQGRLLGVEYGSAGDVLMRQWARRAADVEAGLYPTAAEALGALTTGQVDAALVDAVTAYAFVSGEEAFHLIGPTLEPEPYVVVTGARSPRLLAEINRLLAELERDGTLPDLREKHLGVAAR
jgi:ABC-type amino acid transport substrate-binding protein